MTNPQQRVQLADLAHADKANLVDIWTRLNGQPPSFRASRELLILALAWEIQAPQIRRPETHGPSTDGQIGKSLPARGLNRS